MTNSVNTVLGAIAADKLGVTLLHERLLSVVPGAQYAYDIEFDRAEIYETIAEKLKAFKLAGGSTVVDSSGMFHGRDLVMYEALARETEVNIIASTGLGPEENLGGYFLTPQTNPPTPWPAEKFEDLLYKEFSEGMVRPRLERRAPAGLAAVKADKAGISATEVSLFKGAARAANKSGAALSFAFGADPMADLEQILAEGISPERVVVGDLDRRIVVASTIQELASKGVYVAIDNVGNNSSEYLTDSQRVEIVADLVAAGFANRVIISSQSTAVAKGHADSPVNFAYVLTKFVPALEAKGLSQAQIDQILVKNPAALLTLGDN
ncbi:MAG: phosphotriesterase [Micrococcales bacterium]